MDALSGEIERLRRLKKESDGYLSRSNERRLTKCKAELRRRLGAAVIYAEDRQKIPDHSHHYLLGQLKQIDKFLKENSGATHDGRFFHLMCDCFDFVVSPGTVRRSYYMSDEERELSS